MNLPLRRKQWEAAKFMLESNPDFFIPFVIFPFSPWKLASKRSKLFWRLIFLNGISMESGE